MITGNGLVAFKWIHHIKQEKYPTKSFSSWIRSHCHMVYEKVTHYHPFLSLFVAKVLYILLKKGVDLASIFPLKVIHRASGISHLFFVYDYLFFFKGIQCERYHRGIWYGNMIVHKHCKLFSSFPWSFSCWCTKASPGGWCGHCKL